MEIIDGHYEGLLCPLSCQWSYKDYTCISLGEPGHHRESVFLKPSALFSFFAWSHKPLRLRWSVQAIQVKTQSFLSQVGVMIPTFCVHRRSGQGRAPNRMKRNAWWHGENVHNVFKVKMYTHVYMAWHSVWGKGVKNVCVCYLQDSWGSAGLEYL